MCTGYTVGYIGTYNLYLVYFSQVNNVRDLLKYVLVLHAKQAFKWNEKNKTCDDTSVMHVNQNRSKDSNG
jgi:hypothetical protein